MKTRLVWIVALPALLVALASVTALEAQTPQCAADTAFGNSCAEGVVSSVYVRGTDQLVFFYLENEVIATRGIVGTRNTCITNSYWMVSGGNQTGQTDAQKQAQRQMYAQILAAFTSGKPLRVYGSNTCVRWSNGEDVQTLVLRK